MAMGSKGPPWNRVLTCPHGVQGGGRGLGTWGEGGSWAGLGAGLRFGGLGGGSEHICAGSGEHLEISGQDLGDGWVRCGGYRADLGDVCTGLRGYLCRIWGAAGDIRAGFGGVGDIWAGFGGQPGSTGGFALRPTRVQDVVVAEVQDLDGAVELEQVAQLRRVLQPVQLVVSQVKLPQRHVHLQSRGWGQKRGDLNPKWCWGGGGGGGGVGAKWG